MATGNQYYEEQTKRLLAETRAEIGSIEAQIATLEKRKEGLIEEAQAFEVALRGYLTRTRKQKNTASNWVQLLDHQKHGERLITMAKQDSGTITVKQATDFLYGKGFIRSKKYANAYHIIQILLSRMTQKGVFERVTRGRYRLVGDNRQ